MIWRWRITLGGVVVVLVALSAVTLCAHASLFMKRPLQPRHHRSFNRLLNVMSSFDETEGAEVVNDQAQLSIPIEDRLSLVIKECPLLFVESLVSLFVVLNFFIDVSQTTIPVYYLTKLRRQCCYCVIVTSLVGIMSYFDVADFSIRDTFSHAELYDEALADVNAAVMSTPESQSIGFNVLQLVLGCPHNQGYLLANSVRTIPLLARMVLVIGLIMSPSSYNQPSALLNLLRKSIKITSNGDDCESNNGTEGTMNSIGVDDVVHVVTACIELAIVTASLFSICSVSRGLITGNAVVGLHDVVMAVIKMLLILNYLAISGTVLQSHLWSMANRSTLLSAMTQTVFYRRAIEIPQLRQLLMHLSAKYYGRNRDSVEEAVVNNNISTIDERNGEVNANREHMKDSAHNTVSIDGEGVDSNSLQIDASTGSGASSDNNKSSADRKRVKGKRKQRKKSNNH